MPSDVPDGRDAGGAPGPVITYKLSDEELAQYRGEGFELAFDKLKARLPELHERFARGEAETWKGKQILARQFGVSAQTIITRYKEWQTQQGEAPHAQVESEPKPEPVVIDHAVGTGELFRKAEEQAGVDDPKTEQEPVLTGIGTGNVKLETAPDPLTVTRGTYPVAAEQLRAGMEAAKPEPRPTWPLNLCHSCVKRDICLVAGEVHGAPESYDTSHLPPKLHTMRIQLSARYVEECSAYHAG